MLRKINLYGALEHRYGASVELDVCNMVDTVRGLKCVFPDFYSSIIDGKYCIVVGDDIDNGFQVSEDLLNMRFGPNDKNIHLIPMVQGAAKKNTGKGIVTIVVGIILIVCTWGGASSAVGAAWGGGTAGANAASIGFSMGVGLILSGVSTLLTPGLEIGESANENNSDLINGQSKTSQGSAIPVVYGEYLIEQPLDISVSLSVLNIPYMNPSVF